MRLFTFIMMVYLSLPLLSLFAQEPVPTQPPETYMASFSGNLDVFIDAVSKTCNLNVIYDHNTIQGRKISILSQQKLSQQELYQVFLSILEYHGFIVETVGTDQKLLKIKRNIVGPWTSTPLLTTFSELQTVKEQDVFLTMIIPLQYIKVREVQTTLRALRVINPQAGNLAGIEESNCLLVTDYAPNVRRIYELLQQIDKPMLPISEAALSIEGQAVMIPFVKGEIFADIQFPQNVNITVKNDKGQVILALDPQNVNPDARPSVKLNLSNYFQNNATLQWELEVLHSNVVECTIDIYPYSNKAPAIWSLRIHRGLPKGKLIRFTMSMLAPQK